MFHKGDRVRLTAEIAGTETARYNVKRMPRPVVDWFNRCGTVAGTLRPGTGTVGILWDDRRSIDRWPPHMVETIPTE